MPPAGCVSDDLAATAAFVAGTVPPANSNEQPTTAVRITNQNILLTPERLPIGCLPLPYLSEPLNRRVTTAILVGGIQLVKRPVFKTSPKD